MKCFEHLLSGFFCRALVVQICLSHEMVVVSVMQIRVNKKIGSEERVDVLNVKHLPLLRTVVSLFYAYFVFLTK